MSIGLPQILIILLLVLVIFGAGKLPKVMGDMGKGMKNFKEGLNGGDNETERKAKPVTSDPPTLDNPPQSAQKKDSENSKTEV